MPPRKGRKPRANPKKPKELSADELPKELSAEELQCEKLVALIDQEAERRIAAIKSIRDAEIENLLCRLHFLRSNLSKEHLDSPALEFFQQNFPNLTVIKNEEYKIFELACPSKAGYMQGNHIQPDLMASVNEAGAMRSFDGLQFSVNSVKNNFLEAANVNIMDFENSDNYLLGSKDAFQTPGETSSRPSFGITPKTSRLPKYGEMLLSVHGSPLGVYKEENLQAIRESDERAHNAEAQPDT